MTYRIAVLDDEAAALHRTQEMLCVYERTHPEHEFRISCHSGMQGFMEAVCGTKESAGWGFDILLMDICLPDGNGIEGARILRQKGFAGVIVFQSASPDYAVEAYAVNALQYLVKPVSQEMIDRTIGRAVGEIRRCPVSETGKEIDRRTGSGICCMEGRSRDRLLRDILRTILRRPKHKDRRGR